MRYMTFMTVIGLFLSPSLLSAQSICASLHGQVEKILKHEHHVDATVVPGLWIGVYDGASMCTVLIGDIDSSGLRFELGSASKPVVAWLALEALDSLGFSPTEPVCTFLPDSICTDDLARLHTEHLLTHRAGLSRLPMGIGGHEIDVTDPYRAYGIRELSLDLQEETAVPGMYAYSHTGYAMLYWLFERVGGLPIFLKNQLTVPLQLTNTTFDTSGSLANGHGMDGRPQVPWHTGAFAPAMGLRSDAGDMIRFIRFITPLLIDRIPALTPKMKKEIHRMSRSGMYRVEIGWFLVPSGKDLIYYHNGRTGGHHASIAFSPQKNKGVVILSNGAAGSGELSISILHMLLRSRGPSGSFGRS